MNNKHLQSNYHLRPCGQTDRLCHGTHQRRHHADDMKKDLPVCGGGEAAEAGFVGGGLSALASVAGVAGTASGVFPVGAASVAVDREGACSVGVDREGACSVGAEGPPPAQSVTIERSKYIVCVYTCD